MDLKMDIPSDVIFLMEQLEAASYEAYVVGGCVRDSVLGNTPHDWDITTNARPEEIEAVFEAYPRIDTGKKHGTIAVIYHHDIYEITTYRSEKGYSDFRHPDEVTFETSLDADLSRRDLTINAMAYSLSTGFVDLYGGLDDLHQGIIRCVGDARQRFNEDALRMLRALRFAARFNFTVEVKTAEALHDQTLIERLAFISKERIYSELTKLMLGVNCVPVLRAFRDVIGFCVPELTMMYDCPQHNVYHRYDVYEHTLHALSAMITLDQALSDEERLILRMAILFHDAGKPAAKTTDEDGWDHFYRHEIESARLAESALKRL
ncbi:MAG: CCA tRNA nucleotidyltransferase, partial [bacterium]